MHGEVERIPPMPDLSNWKASDLNFCQGLPRIIIVWAFLCHTVHFKLWDKINALAVIFSNPPPLPQKAVEFFTGDSVINWNYKTL